MKVIKIVCLALLLASASLHAQVHNEYRIQAVYNGKTEAGLRKFFFAIETNSSGKWKNIARLGITTGNNTDMAQVDQDTNVAYMIRYKELLQNAEFKSLYDQTLNEFLKRISMEGMPELNNARNETDNKIFRDSDSKNLIVSMKAGENEKQAVIRICAYDNSKMVVYNKPLKPFSGNFIELSTAGLTPGNYLVVVSTASASYSAEILIM